MPRLPSLSAVTGLARERRSLISIVSIIIAADLLRVALLPLYARLPNGYLDEGFWKNWMQAIHDHGVLNIFRATDPDYVGYQWVLWLLSLIYAAIGGPYTQTSPSLHVLVKTPPLLFDFALILAVYYATEALVLDGAHRANTTNDPDGRRASTTRVDSNVSAAAARRVALVAAAIVAFQPAVVYDSAVWAQTDAGVTAAMLGSIVLAWQRRPALAWSVWTLGFLLKPHPIVIAPVLIIVTLRSGGWRALARSLAVGVAVAAIALGPWIVHGDGVRIAEIYRSLFWANYARLSSSAWNLWWFWDLWAGHPWPDDAFIGPLPMLTYRTVGSALSLAAASLATAYALRRTDLHRSLVAAAYLAFAFYVVPVSTHDRYLYPFLALMLPVAAIHRRWLWLYAPASLTLFLNMFFSAPPVESWAGRWLESPLSLVAAAANVVMFGAFSAVLVRDVAPELWTRARSLAVLVVSPRPNVGQPPSAVRPAQPDSALRSSQRGDVAQPPLAESPPRPAVRKAKPAIRGAQPDITD